jgi:hypothetical protein
MLFNNIKELKYVPKCMKSGTVTPVGKKGKDLMQMDNYRGISVTSLIGKVLEHVVLARKPEQQSDMQYGFTSGLSPKMASVIVHECIINARESKELTFICTLDAVKAFDTVSHASMLRKLYFEGLDLESWSVIKSLYEGMSAKVKWKGHLSSTFGIHQGVRQGGVLSPALYKSYIDGVLHELQASGRGLCIGTTYVGSPGVADDILCTGTSPEDLQSMVNIVNQYAARERYEIHPKKSDIAQFGPVTKPSDYSWKIAGVDKEVCKAITHLGIQYQGCQNRGHHSGPWIKDKLKLVRRTVYGLMGTGLHGSNGVCPSTSLGIFRCYVLSRLLYGLDVADLNKTQMNTIRSQHIAFIRRLQSLPERTALAAVYLLSGTMPIDGEIDKQKLGLIGQISRSQNKAIKSIALYQYATKPMSSNSWFVQVGKLLLAYDLPPLESILKNPPGKLRWKHQVKEAIHTHWTKSLREECATKSTLKFLNVGHAEVGTVHHVWRYIEPCTKDVRCAFVKSKLLTGTYPTQERLSKWSDGKVPALCPLCKSADETVSHFLLSCPATHGTRSRQLPHIITEASTRLNRVEWKDLYEDPDSLVRLVLDCTWYIGAGILNESLLSTFEYHSRRLCYELHCARAHLLLEATKAPTDPV